MFRFNGVAGELRALRSALAELLRAEGWAEDEMSDVLVVASELATNAVMHAQTPYEVRVSVAGGVELEVVDEAPELVPHLRRPGDGPGGMGMRIVDELAKRWGVEKRGNHKAVMVFLDRPRRTAAS